MERIWNEGVLASFEVLPRDGRTKQKPVTTAVLLPEILNSDFRSHSDTINTGFS
jgi:hypothetical protein